MCLCGVDASSDVGNVQINHDIPGAEDFSPDIFSRCCRARPEEERVCLVRPNNYEMGYYFRKFRSLRFAINLVSVTS